MTERKRRKKSDPKLVFSPKFLKRCVIIESLRCSDTLGRKSTKIWKGKRLMYHFRQPTWHNSRNEVFKDTLRITINLCNCSFPHDIQNM
nr:hypothetical protein Iba_chr12aCG15510 [Ipomoea batatas]GMD66685.1 hypothetical protein Iba_chr12cCG17390 [Ipomoea batatas]